MWTLGNIVLTPSVFNLFLIYLSGFLAVVVYMFTKVELFSFGIWMVRHTNHLFNHTVNIYLHAIYVPVLNHTKLTDVNSSVD